MTFKALLLATLIAAPATAQTIRPDQAAFRELYKELVETNTTLSSGSCTAAAAKMGARLKAAGFSDSDITYYATSEKPKEGGLVAVLHGSDHKAKPMLLLAHIDVVEAKREDWTRDPFTLVEEGGYFYARGTADDKAQAAIWTDALIRFKQSGYKPARSIKLALTCGEETTFAFNGAQWLAQNRPDLISAEFALNEGGGGMLDATGRPVLLAMQVGEKDVQNYWLEVTNPGGHSSRPVPENAIYRLSAAVTKVGNYEFPVTFTPTTRAFFGGMSKILGGETGAAMTALLANPNDAAANAIVSKDPSFHSMLRTTCVATLIDGGHALNALPQTVTANVNCRMFPGRTADETQAALEKAIGNPEIKVEQRIKTKPIAKVPPLDPKVVGPMEQLSAKHFPGIPVIPTMSTGATDAVYLGAVGDRKSTRLNSSH